MQNLQFRFTFYYIYIKTWENGGRGFKKYTFTFYYIYIKTLWNLEFYLYNPLYLHSTIFILKPMPEMQEVKMKAFTFYYIYIKTEKNVQVLISCIDLHSTIFILKQ